MSKRIFNTITLISLILIAPQLLAQVKVDNRLPDYQPAKKLNGKLTSIGSDVMNNLMEMWCEIYLKQHPEVKFANLGKGSRTASAGLLSGIAQLGPTSRQFKESEIAAIRKKHKHPPVLVSVAIDGLGIFVHKDNPIKSLTLNQLDAIYSSTRKQGSKAQIKTWGQLGLQGKYKDTKITAFGRNSASSTYAYFKWEVLARGDYGDQHQEMPGSASIVHAVSKNPGAIGYSGIGYKTDDVRLVPLVHATTGKPIKPDRVNLENGQYPLARHFYIATLLPPGAKLEPIRHDFFQFVFSKQGQQVVVKDGYLPLSFEMAKAEAKKLGITLKAAKR